MSRMSALLTKRKATVSEPNGKHDDGASPTISPEKPKDSSAKSRSARTPSFAESLASPQGKAALRHQASNSELRGAATTADGTPMAYDSTTQANHSRSGNFSLDEGSLNGRGAAGVGNRRSRGGPSGLDAPSSSLSSPNSAGFANEGNAHLPRSASLAGHQPVGEGSLSLDALLATESMPDARTPRPHNATLDSPTQPSAATQMHLSPTKSQQQSYPPVFEHSDFANSSSSSGASSPALGTGTNGFPTIQVQRIPSEENVHGTTLNAQGRPSSAATVQATASLLPSARPEDGRGRSSSVSSTSSRTAVSPARSSGSRPKNMRRGSSRNDNGIAGALAASGLAVASMATGMRTGLPAQTAQYINHPGKKASLENGDSKSDMPLIISRSSEENSGYESPTPISNYTPNDSPRYEDDAAFQAMTSIDALGDFEDVVNQLGAGYALASSKRNADFHAIFKNIPEDDFLIEDYGCALQREILIQGRLYISEHHLCFNANIFGWVTTLVLAFNEIISIEKRNTALVIPNAVHIATMHARNTFASFLSRDMTHELIVSLWRNQHPVVPLSAALPDSVLTDDEDEFGMSNVDEAGQDGDGDGKKRRTKRGRFRRKKGGSTAQDTQEKDALVSAAARNLPTGTHPRQSLGGPSLAQKAVAVNHPPTKCNCESGGTGHFTNTVMDVIFPGSPEKLYNLIFTSGFMKDFLSNDMALLELQIGDWAPQKSGSHLLTRSYNYIKPLNAPVGPKSAKCILVDENLHVDFDDFVTTLTTTRTPEVPSGGSFAVKTKTCCMWAKNNSTRVLVTTSVEWTGRSFIKGIIDRSSIDGQKTLYTALEKSVRGYIAQHKSEFYNAADEDQAEGDADEAEDGPLEDAHARKASPTSGATAAEPSAATTKEPLAFISNTVPQAKPICDFLTTLWDTASDLFGQMSLTALICSAIILVLLLSNLFTLSSLRKSSSRYIPTRRPPPDYSRIATGTVSEQSEVAAAVRGVLQDYFDSQKQGSIGHGGAAALGTRSGLTTREEIDEMRQLLDTLEGRVQRLKQSLSELD